MCELKLGRAPRPELETEAQPARRRAAVWQWFRRSAWLHLWPPLIAWMGMIFFLSAQPDLPNPETGLAGELLSSGAHTFVFGVLAIFWVRVFGGRRHAWLLAFALTMLYALSDEFHQAFVPGRYPDPWDLFCDGLGAALALAGWAWLQRQKRTTAEPD